MSVALTTLEIKKRQAEKPAIIVLKDIPHWYKDIPRWYKDILGGNKDILRWYENLEI